LETQLSAQLSLLIMLHTNNSIISYTNIRCQGDHTDRATLRLSSLVGLWGFQRSGSTWKND